MSDRKYVIINASEVSSVDFNKVYETSTNTLRYNNDNTQTFVKFTGDTPSFLDGKTQHTHTQIVSILNDVNGDWWTEPDFVETLFSGNDTEEED